MPKLNQNLEQVIHTVSGIATLPIIYQRVMEIIRDEDASLGSLTAVIGKDQVLASKLLKVVNSSFYCSLGSVSSIERALVILGTEEVQSIILGLSVYNFFSTHASDDFDSKQFWRHSIICSQISKLLATHFRTKDDGTLFLSGLLHDIGKIVIDQFFHEEFLQIIEHVSSKKTTFDSAERKILGWTHYQLGARLLQHWNFPAKIVKAVLYHHRPWHNSNSETGPMITYLSNILTKSASYPFHPHEKQIDPMEFANSMEVRNIIKSGLNLEAENIPNLISHIRELIREEANNVLMVLEEDDPKVPA